MRSVADEQISENDLLQHSLKFLISHYLRTWCSSQKDYDKRRAPSTDLQADFPQTKKAAE